MLKLKCVVQSYDWGKIGASSEVAKLMKSANPDFEMNNLLPYAELWMGTHPNGPSFVVSEGSPKPLQTWLEEHTKSLGDGVIDNFGSSLPFLFKVLSVNKALSIQAHPDKTHAEKLHAARPDLYKDPNHKPEMAIALTPFEALCGFRPSLEILNFLRNIPELKNIVGEGNIKNFENSCKRGDDVADSLKACFRALMSCPDSILAEQIEKFAARLTSIACDESNAVLGNLFLRLRGQFPGDVGCFGIYFFNFLKLKPGEAIFLGPNVPHAYLNGDCIESMACSDNVVRAGLTPKYKDVTTLCEMLKYEPATAEEQLFEGSKLDEFAMLFSPPVLDFAIMKIEIPASVKSYTLNPLNSASIMLCVSGKGDVTLKDQPNISLSLVKGSVIFISASSTVNFTNISSDGILLFSSFANV